MNKRPRIVLSKTYSLIGDIYDKWVHGNPPTKQDSNACKDILDKLQKEFPFLTKGEDRNEQIDKVESEARIES